MTEPTVPTERADVVDLSFVPIEDPAAERAELVAFLTGNEWPFHVVPHVTEADVDARLDSGGFRDDDHAASWIDVDGRRVGLVILEDLTDGSPLFDLRLASSARGRGLGVVILQALSELVFSTWPEVQRFEGQTRDDNVPMRRTFERAGWVQEAYYREAWPVTGASPRGSVAYSILRRDWETGTTTPVPR